MAIWNAFDPDKSVTGPPRHIREFTVFTDTQSDFSTATNVGSFINPQDVAGIAATIFDLVDSHGQYVRVQINSNYGHPDFTQAGEFALAVVPEPSAFLYGGLISSIVGCGVWAKRRMG